MRHAKAELRHGVILVLVVKKAKPHSSFNPVKVIGTSILTFLVQHVHILVACLQFEGPFLQSRRLAAGSRHISPLQKETLGFLLFACL